MIIRNWPEITSPALKSPHALQPLQALLETELHKAFDNAVWFRKNHQAKRLRQAELNGIASELAGRRFKESPSLHNELLNRQKRQATPLPLRITCYDAWS